ncbi:MAG TPA: putative manganese transporter, partial [Candidatus Cloacimonadota bacterium]|nr:putative manganese transporter [Candidatus Cloacimonadota bacterium]
MIWEILEHSAMITGFVFSMMLVIEYINVQTRGHWHAFIRAEKWLQYVLAAALGSIPGCLGSFTVVALFSHNIVSLGALVTTMIATSGDEAFVMLAMFPGKALLLFGIIFVIGIAAGFATDLLFPNINLERKFSHREFPLHKEEKCHCFSPRAILK